MGKIQVYIRPEKQIRSSKNWSIECNKSYDEYNHSNTNIIKYQTI